MILKVTFIKLGLGSGLTCVLDKKYIGSAVTAMLLNLGIGIKAIAISALALIIKLGIEVYCDRFKPDLVMADHQAR